jgi:transcriptional regulator with XRE-family HTH domain
MSLSETIRNAVLFSGLSQRQIEEETGLGRGLLARFLSGERDIQLSTADRLADYFGLTLAPADSTNNLLFHVLSEVRHIAEKARVSASLTLEELDALRGRLSHSQFSLGVAIELQSGSLKAVEMEMPQCLITQPRKKGRPKITVRGVRDTALAESAPSVSTAGENLTNNPANHKGDSAKSSQAQGETSPPQQPEYIDAMEVTKPLDSDSIRTKRRRVVTTEVKRRSDSVQGEASRVVGGIPLTDAKTPHGSPKESDDSDASSGDPASTRVSKTTPREKKNGKRGG